MKSNRLLPASTTILAGIFLSACVPMQPLPELDCDPGTTVKVTYGISQSKTIFQVKEKVNVKKGEGLIFKLDPKGGNTPKVADFKDANVTIEGKPGGNNGWISPPQGSYNGTAGSGHKVGVCADTDIGTYEYKVHVAGLGTLDPRIIVEQ